MFEFDDLDEAAPLAGVAELQGPLADLLSEDADVRWRACLELKKSGTVADIPKLEALVVSEKVADVRRAAKKAIQEIRNPVVRPDAERAAQVAAAQAQWQAAVVVTEPYEAAEEEEERQEVPSVEEIFQRDAAYREAEVVQVPEPEVMEEPIVLEQPREAAESEVVPMPPVFVLANFDDDDDEPEPARRDLTFVDVCNRTFEQQLLKKREAAGKATKRPPRAAQPGGVAADVSAATASSASTAPAPAPIAGQPSNGDLKQALFRVFKEVLPMRLPREGMTPAEIANIWENTWGVQYASRVRFQAPPDWGSKWLSPREDAVPCSPTVVPLEASRGAVLYSLATALRTFGGLSTDAAALERERRFQQAVLDEEKRHRADAKEVSRYQKFEVRRWYDNRHQ